MTKAAQRAAEAAVAPGSRKRDAMVVQLIEEARQRRGMYRTQLAAALGIHPRSLRNWLARASTLKGHEVAKLVEALGMSAENRANLYVLTGQLPPAPAVGELLRTPEMALYQSMIDGLEHPSVVYSECWDVVITNQAFRDIFGGVRRHATAHPLRNTQRFIFFHPDAPILLGGGNEKNFHDHWLMPALAHFSATLQQRPAEPRLQAIEQDIDERPVLRRAYRRAPRWIAENGDININPSARLFWDPRVRRLVNAHIITEAHQGYQETTLQRATFIFRECQRPPASPYKQDGLFDLGLVDEFGTVPVFA